MGRYRYLIERGSDEVYLTTITRGDPDGRALRVADVETAKKLAAQSPDAPDGGLRWRDPPVEWQPDAICISNWLDDGVEENTD